MSWQRSPLHSYIFRIIALLCVAMFLTPPNFAHAARLPDSGDSVATSAEAAHGIATSLHAHPTPEIVWALPFAALLLAIAICPLVKRVYHHWESNLVKLCTGLALSTIVIAYYAFRGFGFHDAAPGIPSAVNVLQHALFDEYIPFMILLFSLYVIAGGVRLRGDLLALPTVNTGFLAVGAVLASIIGTTGASMVLIRPLLQTNRDRHHVTHTVIFFIFLVSNIGGTLLPVGDPPLFIGYLKGVPFFWTLQLALPWLVTVAALLVIYFLWDRFLAFPREPNNILRIELEHRTPLRLDGAINILWLLGVVAAVALIVPGKTLPGTSWVFPRYLREGILLGLSAVSLVTTPRGLRHGVGFSYHPILEVAALFLGIFLTMQVPIEILQAKGAELGVTSPLQFFWSTGILSSFLDNAPTYLVFFETARSLPFAEGAALIPLNGGPPIPVRLLVAISLGAVFMGANTYIGNGPNFMVKSIAESHGVKMPSFFGYMVYSVAILIPLFAAIGWFFVR